MKQLVLLMLLVIFIPYLVFTFFKKEIIEYNNKQKFQYGTNMTIRVKRVEQNKIDVVPFEEYITGVLAGEMPVSFEMEALKAQAVAARSYAMKRMEYNKNTDYDVVDTTTNQRYLDNEYLKNTWKNNYDKYITKIRLAVITTLGEYLEYDGKVVDAFFFSTSVGKTENVEEVFSAALPYLRSVDSSWDAKVSPVYEEKYKFILDSFCQALSLECTTNIETEVVEQTSTGRVKKIKINNKTFTGSDLVNALKLRSTHFIITQNNNEILITTKGYGHGVGMSQYGAEGMAEAGYQYAEILLHYYQGVNIKKI